MSDWRPRVDRVDDPLVEDHWAYQKDGLEVVSRVMVGRPHPIPNDSQKTWYCPVSIEHHEPEVRCVFGVGPVDTLMNAMQYVRNFFNEVRPSVRAGRDRGQNGPETETNAEGTSS